MLFDEVTGVKKYIEKLETEFSSVANGYKYMEKRALADFNSGCVDHMRELAFTAYNSEVHQVRMYAVFILGYMSEDKEILNFMKEQVSRDNNWRVQEILAKSFDEYCKRTGYKKSLPVIDEWLKDENPNVRRAVTEGLRIWTGRPYFKGNPDEAIKRLSNLRADDSEYVRKSVGNALRDISKKHPDFIKRELSGWDLEDDKVKQVYKLASKFVGG